jgi:hypothetical protein
MPRTLAQVKSELASWEACLESIRTGQEYRIGARWLTRANLNDVWKIVQSLRLEAARLESGRGSGPQVTRVVPVDL